MIWWTTHFDTECWLHVDRWGYTFGNLLLQRWDSPSERITGTLNWPDCGRTPPLVAFLFAFLKIFPFRFFISHFSSFGHMYIFPAYISCFFPPFFPLTNLFLAVKKHHHPMDFSNNKSSLRTSPLRTFRFKSPRLKRWRSTRWIGWCFEDTSSLEFCVLWFRRSRGVTNERWWGCGGSTGYDVWFIKIWRWFWLWLGSVLCVVFRVSFLLIFFCLKYLVYTAAGIFWNVWN